MKIFSIIITTFLSTTIFAQTKTFTLLDTNVIAGQIYTTRQIQFDLAKRTVRPESNILLDSIVSFMNRNKKVVIEIGVHLDSRAIKHSSDNLSMYRATSIANYLIKQGIPADRIIAKGYGAIKLLISDATINKANTREEKETLHVYNRRVTLKVISS